MVMQEQFTMMYFNLTLALYIILMSNRHMKPKIRFNPKFYSFAVLYCTKYYIIHGYTIESKLKNETNNSHDFPLQLLAIYTNLF